MNVQSPVEVKIRACRLVCLCLVIAVGACNQGPDEELSSTRPYADLIGTEYRVVADDLNAYGIYGSWPDKTVTRVTLIPGLGIGGREIAFRRHVSKGQTIRILSAWRQPFVLDNGLYLRMFPSK